jgi:F-type H+-transporting ATPase subunit alpha
VEILKQGLHQPMSVEKQVAIIYCGVKGLLAKIPVGSIKEFEKDYLEMLETKYKAILDKLAKGELNDEITSTLEKVAKESAEKYITKEK